MAKISILESIPYLLMSPSKKIWVDYDEDTDVMYISFYKPQKANDSIMEDNVIYHYRNNNLVGITVLRAAETYKERKESIAD